MGAVRQHILEIAFEKVLRAVLQKRFQPEFGAGFEIALEPSKLQKEGENPGKGHLIVCAKLSYALTPGSKEI